MALLRQTWTLTLKSLLIAFVRHAFSTTIRAFLLPLLLVSKTNPNQTHLS